MEKTNKNILFYITNYPGYGGIEKITTILANCLIKNNYNIFILSFHNGDKELLNEINPNIKLFFPPNQDELLTEENNLYVKGIFNKYKFDWIIYQDCYSPIHEILLKNDTINIHNKLIVVEHNSPCCQLKAYQNYWNKLNWFTLKDSIRKIIYPYKRKRIYEKTSARHKILLEHCYRYILLSDSFKKEINYLVGHKYKEKIISIPNPVTLPPISDTKKIQKKQEMIFIGRLVEDKGIKYLLKIWETFKKTENNWNLTIIGKGPLQEFIENEIKNRKIKDIQLLGTQKNVSPYLENASVLLMTSIFEGFPLVLSEAMSRGCVPIAFNSFSSIKDIIDHKINGILIPPFDIKLYVKSLLYITHNQFTLNQLAVKAQEKAQTFSLHRVEQLWINLLQ